MIHLRVHVGVEAVFLRGRFVPRRVRLIFHQGNSHDRFDRLETVFPRHDQTHRGTVLVGDRFVVQARRHDRQRMHRFVQTQTLSVGPIEDRVIHGLHDIGQHRGFEGDELRVRLHAHLRQQFVELEPVPRDDHRPCLDAAETVYPLLRRDVPDQVSQLIVARVVDKAVDLHGPWLRLHRAGVLCRIALARSEFVEVVVAGNLLPAVRLKRLVLRSRGQPHRPRDRPRPEGSKQLAAVHPDTFGRHIGAGQVRFEHQGLNSSLTMERLGRHQPYDNLGPTAV
ncbi:hypothetical protein JDO7802_00892 [Jannaschia donghaensis]|uniref:Uncharacterized protein n=1 Tax=Jannaschia donghaensis TaxID=420998 RepID=A0A0M6YG20_9RHOB|nr:hypothetical protein JDO7802_00892 [Jannaschia donghaensis]